MVETAVRRRTVVRGTENVGCKRPLLALVQPLWPGTGVVDNQAVRAVDNGALLIDWPGGLADLPIQDPSVPVC